MSEAVHPKLSVVMPVRNGERFLAEAVDSVLAQTYADFQFVIVDDGSTDRTGGILQDYARRDRRVQVVRGPGRGIVAALTAGLAAARGAYVARMDADDICLPERFDKQVRHLDDHPDCVLVGSRVLLIDEEGAPIRQWCGETDHEAIDDAHLNWGWPVVHPAVMMRRAAVDSAGGYREKYAHIEDLDLFLRLGEIGRLCNLPDVLLKYRKHMASICQQRGNEQHALKVELYRETYARRGLAADVVAPPPGVIAAADLHKLWGWWALQSGFVGTARKHAVRALRHRPAATDSWRLMYCAMRGR